MTTMTTTTKTAIVNDNALNDRQKLIVLKTFTEYAIARDMPLHTVTNAMHTPLEDHELLGDDFTLPSYMYYLDVVDYVVDRYNEIVDRCGVDDFLSVYNDYCTDKLDPSEQIHSMEDLDDVLDDFSPTEIIEMANNNDFDPMHSDYFRFDGSSELTNVYADDIDETDIDVRAFVKWLIERMERGNSLYPLDYDDILPQDVATWFGITR